MDEDPLQRRIYFLTFIDSLDMIFLNKEELLKSFQIIQIVFLVGRVKYYAKQAIRNLLYANSAVHSRRFIAEFPKYGIKCLEKLQSHCANMTFADKSRYDRTFQQVTHKVG